MGDKEEWSSLQLLLEGDSVVRATAFFADAAPAISVDLLTHRLMRDRITAQLPSDLETAVRLKMARFGQIRNPTMLQRVFSREPGQLRIITGIFATNDQGRWINLPTARAWLKIGVDPPSISGRTLFSQLVNGEPRSSIPGLAEDAKEWFSASRNATSDAFAGPNMADVMPVSGYDGALSSVIEQWAKTTGKDVVMELAPVGESLFYGYPNLPPLQALKLSVKASLIRDDSWGMEYVDGVLVVRNRMAFLDRTADCPIGSIAHYLRTCAKRFANPLDITLESADVGPGLPLIMDVLPLMQKRQGHGFRDDAWFDAGGYRGLTDAYLRGRSALLWPGFPSEIISAIRKAPTGKEEFPLSRCGEDAIDQLALAMAGIETSPAWIRHIGSVIADSKVSVEWKQAKGNEVEVLVDLTHVSDETLGMNNRIAFRVRF